MNRALSILHPVIAAHAGIQTVVFPTGRGDYLWEPRPRGDARFDAPQTFDRGEGAAPTTTPSPLMGEGGGEGERGQPTQPSLVRTKPTSTLSFPPDGAADYLWEARPRADYRDCFGDVVDMPQCVFGARRPSHRSSQVPAPNPLSLPDSGVLRNDVLKVRLQ